MAWWLGFLVPFSTLGRPGFAAIHVIILEDIFRSIRHAAAHIRATISPAMPLRHHERNVLPANHLVKEFLSNLITIRHKPVIPNFTPFMLSLIMIFLPPAAIGGATAVAEYATTRGPCPNTGRAVKADSQPNKTQIKWREKEGGCQRISGQRWPWRRCGAEKAVAVLAGECERHGNRRAAEEAVARTMAGGFQQAQWSLTACRAEGSQAFKTRMACEKLVSMMPRQLGAFVVQLSWWERSWHPGHAAWRPSTCVRRGRGLGKVMNGRSGEGRGR